MADGAHGPGDDIVAASEGLEVIDQHPRAAEDHHVARAAADEHSVSLEDRSVNDASAVSEVCDPVCFAFNC